MRTKTMLKRAYCTLLDDVLSSCTGVVPVVLPVVLVVVTVAAVRQVPLNVTLEVKLLGDTPTLYCWKVVTPEEELALQTVDTFWTAAQMPKEVCWQH